MLHSPDMLCSISVAVPIGRGVDPGRTDQGHKCTVEVGCSGHDPCHLHDAAALLLIRTYLQVSTWGG